tara:strand:- start:2387 stop:3343 length:957 start_codon:yes stop_codon:yes gene_type:complete
MSDSTIDDALKLLEIGKGNPDRLKQIIQSFQTKSMISMYDRKYVDALVEQYLTPRHRQIIHKTKKVEKQTNFPRIRKKEEQTFKITEVKTASEIPHIKPSRDRNETKQMPNSCNQCGAKILNIDTFCTNCGARFGNVTPSKKEELVSKEPTIEEKFIEHIEADRTNKKKSNKGKIAGIIIGVIAVIVIGGGIAFIGSDSDLFSSNTVEEERLTCKNQVMLVSSTKIPNFPAPGKDLQYYQDRYNNEPQYREWFDRNFPDQTVEEVLVPQMDKKATKIPGFPDPEKDLQHYLDRYKNELQYREWFDRNFPDQTVRDAVC